MGVQIPTEYALSIYVASLDTEAKFAIKPHGYHTMSSLRIRKCYRHAFFDSFCSFDLNIASNFTVVLYLCVIVFLSSNTYCL